MNSHCCMILALLCVVAVSAATSAAQGLGTGTTEGAMGGAMGGYTTITDLNDERLQDIAKYAIAEYNQKERTNLEYLKLVRGDYQVVAGNNYRLVISAMLDGNVQNFQAVVNDRPWEMARTLISFDTI